MKSTKRGETKADAAYRKVRSMIVRGLFSEGAGWSLRKLSTRLKMSVVPISEAVRKLEQDGLLVTRPQSGIRLRQLSVREMRDLSLLREAIEVQAARLAAMRGDSRRLARLTELAEQIRQALDRKDVKRAVHLDFEMHRTLVRASGSKLLASTHDDIALVCTVCFEGGTTEGWVAREHTGGWRHSRLAEAVCSGDPDKAERAVRRHIGAEQVRE